MTKRFKMRHASLLLVLVSLTLVYQNCSSPPTEDLSSTGKPSAAASPTPTDNGTPYGSPTPTPIGATPTPPPNTNLYGCYAAVSDSSTHSSQQSSAQNCLQYCKNVSTYAAGGLSPQNNWNVCWFNNGFIYDNGAGNATYANCHASLAHDPNTPTHGTFRSTAAGCRQFCENESDFTKTGLQNGWNVCWYVDQFIH